MLFSTVGKKTKSYPDIEGHTTGIEYNSIGMLQCKSAHVLWHIDIYLGHMSKIWCVGAFHLFNGKNISGCCAIFFC